MEDIFLMWYDGQWTYLGSDQRFRGGTFGGSVHGPGKYSNVLLIYIYMPGDMRAGSTLRAHQTWTFC